jgi:hypothetical protein
LQYYAIFYRKIVKLSMKLQFLVKSAGCETPAPHPSQNCRTVERAVAEAVRFGVLAGIGNPGYSR